MFKEGTWKQVAVQATANVCPESLGIFIESILQGRTNIAQRPDALGHRRGGLPGGCPRGGSFLLVRPFFLQQCCCQLSLHGKLSIRSCLLTTHCRVHPPTLTLQVMLLHYGRESVFAAALACIDAFGLHLQRVVHGRWRWNGN